MERTQKPTMTINDVVKELRALGIPVSNRYAADSIEKGYWPFGRVSSNGNGHRRKFEIWRVDFEKWLEARLPAADTKEVIDNDGCNGN